MFFIWVWVAALLMERVIDCLAYSVSFVLRIGHIFQGGKCVMTVLCMIEYLFGIGFLVFAFLIAW